MTPLQQYNSIVNTAADLLVALDKLDSISSSINRSNATKLRKLLKIEIAQCRLFVAPLPAIPKQTTPTFNHRYSHLAR